MCKIPFELLPQLKRLTVCCSFQMRKRHDGIFIEDWGRRTNHLLPTNTRSLTPTSPANSKIPKNLSLPCAFQPIPTGSMYGIFTLIYPKKHLNLGLIYHTSFKPHHGILCFRICHPYPKRSSHIFSTCNIFRIFWTAIWFGAFPLIASVSCAALPPCTRKAASQ